MSPTPARPRTHDTGHGGRSARELGALTSLWSYLWPRGRLDVKLRVVGALGCLTLAKLALVYVPLIFRDLVDALSTDDPAALAAVPLVGILAAYGLVRLASVLFQELREALFARVSQQAMRTVALETFRHLHALALRFHLERQTGGLSRVIERGIKGIEFLLSFMLFNILPTLLEILLVCAVLWTLFDWRFAAVTFLSVATYIAFTLVITEWRLKYRRAMNDRDTEANTRAIDSLLNYETVKYFSNEAHEARRYDMSMRAYEEAAVRSTLSLSALNIGQGTIIALGLVLVMLLAGMGRQAGDLSVGDVVAANTYLIQLFMPLNFLGFVYRQIRQSLSDMDAMFGLLKTEQEVKDRPGAPDIQMADRREDNSRENGIRKTGGALRFEAVAFGYDPRRRILHDVSFEVPPGGTVAIVGPSGAGKSTIGRLLFRFYDPQDGRLTLDGQDIAAVTQASLRRQIGIVPQDTVLFNDTVYYNIAYGRPDATPAEIEDAARLAHIHAFVTGLPDGYQTMVGERGLKLSGGEKQRVAIARAILKNPRIMLFDEATSALDTATEKDIQANLREVARDRTTLVIAHRLSTVVDADDILVLDAGRIIERGRHADLLAHNGAYAALWRRQQDDHGQPGTAAPAPAG